MQLTPKVFDACAHLGRKKNQYLPPPHVADCWKNYPPPQQPQQVALFSNLT